MDAGWPSPNCIVSDIADKGFLCGFSIDFLPNRIRLAPPLNRQLRAKASRIDSTLPTQLPNELCHKTTKTQMDHLFEIDSSHLDI